jgi:hypothetical protein
LPDIARGAALVTGGAAIGDKDGVDGAVNGSAAARPAAAWSAALAFSSPRPHPAAAAPRPGGVAAPDLVTCWLSPERMAAAAGSAVPAVAETTRTGSSRPRSR